MIDLSVIVPVYNVAAYLSKCVDSILTQKYSNMEIILVNDGSTDQSGQICDAYAKKNERIRVVHKENGGLISARKAGISVAKGEFITFVDGDDWIEGMVYKEICTEMWEKKLDIMISGIVVYGAENTSYERQGNNLPDGFYSEEKLKKELIPHMVRLNDFNVFGIMPSLCNKIFRKTLIVDHYMCLPVEVSIAEDDLSCYFCICNAEAVKINSDLCYYHYRYNATSVSRDYDLQYYIKLENVFQYLEQKKDIIHNFKLEQQFRLLKLYLVASRLEKEFALFRIKKFSDIRATVGYVMSLPYVNNLFRQELSLEDLRTENYWETRRLRALRSKRIKWACCCFLAEGMVKLWKKKWNAC